MVDGLLIAALKMVEYRYLVLEHSFEIYGGLVALLFARAVPVRVEVEVRVHVPVPVAVPVPAAGPFVRNEARLQELGITPRELEIRVAVVRSTRSTHSTRKGFHP